MATADLILAADFGTSGVKVGVVAEDFRLVAAVQEAYPLHLPGPSQAEQAPEDWWAALARGVARLATEVPNLPHRVGAVVFCAQMCGLVCADPRGTPLRPALVWLDKRSAPLLRPLLGGFPQVSGYQVAKLARWIRLSNGAPSHNGMDPTGKMLWIRDEEPETYARTHLFMDVKDWLLHRATGTCVATADSANLTWLMDTRPGREGWSTELSARVGIPLEKLPPIVDGDAVVGGLTAAAASQLGLRADTPVLAGGGDVVATALGSGAVADGALHICVSTSTWISGFFDRRVLSVKHSYATVTSPFAFRPLLIATQESAGSAFHWLAETLEPGRHAQSALNAFYDGIGPSRADDPYFLPWLAGERVPVDEERLRGAFHGLSLRHDQAAIKRAVVEGVALNTRWAYSKVLREKGAQSQGVLPLVGGAAANPYLAQAMADALNRQIRVGDTSYTGVRGAAAMAAPTLGWTEDVWQAAGMANGKGQLYDPEPAQVALLQDRFNRLEDVRKSLVRLYKRPSPKGVR